MSQQARCHSRTFGEAACELALGHRSPHEARLGHGVTVHWPNYTATVPAGPAAERPADRSLAPQPALSLNGGASSVAATEPWMSGQRSETARADPCARAASARATASALCAKASSAHRVATAQCSAAITTARVVTRTFQRRPDGQRPSGKLPEPPPVTLA